MEILSRERLAAEPHWYAAYTLPRHEKVVSDQLTQYSMESYLPLYSAVRDWNGRRATVELPLFPGYLFVRMRLGEKGKVLSRPGIVRLVSFNSTPAVLTDEEIERLRFSLSKWKATPYPFFVAGSKVRIRCGAFGGLEGKILRLKGKTGLLVTLDLIQSSILLEIKADEAEVTD